MRKLLFCRIYCDLALITAIVLIFCPIYANPKTLSTEQFLSFYMQTAITIVLTYLVVGALISFVIIIIQNGSDKMLSYTRQVLLLKIEIILLVSIMLITTPLDLGNKLLVENIALPFMILFIVLSVFLLRTQRDLGNKTAIKKNIAISGVIMIFTLLLSGTVRQMLVLLGSHLVTDVLKVDNNHVARIISGGAPQKEVPIKDGKDIQPTKSIDITRIIIISAVIIIIVVLLILFIRRIIRYFRTVKKHENEQLLQKMYNENREFIRPSIKNTTAKRKIFGSRDSRDIVRACYTKFMQLCKKWKIDIKSSDTTRQINDKYGQQYLSTASETLRGIYIRVRYGSETVDKELAEQSMAEYRQIRREASQVKGQSL